MLPLPIPEPSETTHFYRVIDSEGTPGGYKFFGIRYVTGSRPATAFGDTLDEVKAKLK